MRDSATKRLIRLVCPTLVSLGRSVLAAESECSMGLDELLELPVGAQVLGQLQITKQVSGVVEAMKDGPRFIRWADGYVTFLFGWIRDYDEYVAARTEVQQSRCLRIHLEPETKEVSLT
jgi:hypothetical protein